MNHTSIADSEQSERNDECNGNIQIHTIDGCIDFIQTEFGIGDFDDRITECVGHVDAREIPRGIPSLNDSCLGTIFEPMWKDIKINNEKNNRHERHGHSSRANLLRN